MTEKSKPDTRSTPEKYLAVATAVGSFLPIVAVFFDQPWIFTVIIGIAVVSFFAVIASWKSELLTEKSALLTESSGILGGDGNPIELPIFRGKRRKRIFVAMSLSAFGFAFIYFFRYDISPIASITKCVPSNIRFNDEATNPRFKSMKVPARHYFLSTADENVFEEMMCYTAATLTVSRNGDRPKSIRIESVEFDVEHIPFFGWRYLVGVGPHKVSPTRFNVELNPNVSKVKATMLDENGNPTEGSLVLNDDHEFAILHIRFDGKTGLYKVSPQITVADGMGKHRRTITYPEPVYIGVREEQEGSIYADKRFVRLERDPEDKTLALMIKDGKEHLVTLFKDKEKTRQSEVP